MKNYIKAILLPILLITYSCEKNEIEGTIENNSKIIQDGSYVTFYTAKEIASSIKFNTKVGLVGKKSDKMEKTVEGGTSMNDGNGIAVCHILNYKEGGFVVISADNRIEPILAYSDTEKFELDLDAIPFGPRGWLDYVSESISEIRRTTNKTETELQNETSWEISSIQGLISNSDFTYKPKDLMSSDDCPDPKNDCWEDEDDCFNSVTEVGPLLNTKWGQEVGFNNYSP